MTPLARLLTFAAAAAAASLGATAAFADVKAGVDAWQAGNFAGAVKEWRPLAEQGDADAQFNLGQAYKLGRGVPASLQAAQSWYAKAAQNGHSQAQANLGLILFQDGDRKAAMPWIRKAAEAGDPRAQYVLGTAMFNGDHANKDWARAYALMTRAAAQGLPQAATSLEQMDKYIPLAQRQSGIALAQQMEAGGAASVARLPRVAGTVARTEVPPSAPGRQAAAPAPVASAADGRWRIQLGAFSNAANAQRHWAAVKGKAGALASLQPQVVPAGSVTRLQAGPLASRAEATRACAAAKAAGSACFPVAP